MSHLSFRRWLFLFQFFMAIFSYSLLFVRNKHCFFLFFILFKIISSIKAEEPDSLTLYSKLKNVTSDTEKVNTYIHLSKFYLQKDLNKSLEYAELGTVLASQIDYQFGLGKSYNAEGEGNYLASNYDEARTNFLNGLVIFKTLSDKIGIAESTSGLGKVLYKEGKLDESLKKYIEVLNTYEKLNYKRGLTGVYINIGLLYDELKSHEQAIEFYNKALSIAKDEGDTKSMASCYNNLGSVYTDQHKFDLAIECLERSLKIKEKEGNRKGAASTLNNIGATYYEMNNIDKALEYFEKANLLYIQLGDIKGEFPSCNNIGTINLDKKNYDKALLYFNKAYSLAQQLKSNKHKITCLENLTNVHEALGNNKLALEYAMYCITLKDTLYDSEKTAVTVEMQTKFATEKKQQENEILNLQVKSESFIKTIFIIAACLLFVIAFFIFRGLKQKQKANTALEEKNKIIEEQKLTVEKQKHIVEEQNKDITDSIRYAERIQNAILPPEQLWYSLLPESFVFYKPKDILSGDFYWIEQKGDLIFVAAADCTGHGVPGALISIINYNLMNKAVLEKDLNDPADILNYVNNQLIIALHQTYQDSTVKDGMDISLCVINTKTLELKYAGANNPIYVFKHNELTQLVANKFPVGAFIEEQIQTFTSQKIRLQKGDAIYLFSDGYADQFGGENGKKFKYQQFKNTLTEIQDKPMKEQHNVLARTFNVWRGKLEQVDDVLVIGIKI